jgi:hypothetical protein
MTVGPRVLRSVPISTGTEGARVRRADIEVAGLDQAGSSFELRIFLNNPAAEAATEPIEERGYAGSIYVYAYGRPPDGMRTEGLPMTRSIIATEAVRRARADGPTASVTLVAIPADSPGPAIDLGAVEVAVIVDEQQPAA